MQQTKELERDREAADTTLRHVNSERLRHAISDLARFGGRDDGGVSRQTLTSIDLQARRHLISWATSRNYQVEVDDCANLFFRRPGTQDLPAVLTGSHVDTQPVGGKLDGAYGVLAGLEVLQALDDAGIQTRHPVDVVVWTNEEGSRFGPGCMGSSAYVDPSRLAAYRAVRDDSQDSFGEAVDRALQDIPEVPRRRLQQPLAGFVELHIEQGPVLETAGVSLGVVTGIQSVRWYRVKVTGVAAHAGTTPMDIRTDAMAAAIKMAHQLYTEAALRQVQGLRLTLGRWVVSPNSINTIPGEVEFTLDMRCADDALLTEFDSVMRTTLQECTGRTQVELDLIFQRQPTHFDPEMVALVEEACARACELAALPAAMPLMSGAFHDAMYLADHCPTAMLFVPSMEGISHNAAEQTDQSDLYIGAQALAYAVVRMAGV